MKTRVLVALALIMGMLLGWAGPAEAALSCPSGNVCAWRDISGTTSRCTWDAADNDWRNTPVVCSWAASRVKAMYNNGTSSTYDGVCVYTGANCTGTSYWLPQRGGSWIDSTGVVMRSHRWVRPSDPCGSTGLRRAAATG